MYAFSSQNLLQVSTFCVLSPLHRFIVFTTYKTRGMSSRRHFSHRHDNRANRRSIERAEGLPDLVEREPLARRRGQRVR